MNPAIQNSEGSQLNDRVFARFQVQDIHFINALRELFESMGTSVLLNRHTREKPTYIICAGDSDFVKAFYESEKFFKSQVLLIVYGADADSTIHPSDKNIKIFLSDTKPLTEQDAAFICGFFFTSSKSFMDARKETFEMKSSPITLSEPAREEQINTYNSQKEVSRITRALEDIYGVKKNPGKKSNIIRHLRLVLRILFLPFVIYVITLFIGMGLLGTSAYFLKKDNTYWASRMLSYSRTNLYISETIIQTLAVINPTQKAIPLIDDQLRLLDIARKLSYALERGAILVTSGKQFIKNVISQEGNSMSVSTIVNLRDDITLVRLHIALAAANVDVLRTQKYFPFSIPVILNRLDQYSQVLKDYGNLITHADNMLTVYPLVSGYRSPQTYLVLLQNSMELRPTGGFIGSIMRLTLSEGKLKDIAVEDVYTVDGQLKGHVDPPEPIRQLLPNEHWYLRDSNWDPDFSKSGPQAAWFYEKETGTKVDGVFAISSPVLTRLLSVLGSIELPDFNERITASNFFAKSLLYTQTDFFPGSTQKKDFLGNLSNALLMRITQNRQVPIDLLTTVLSDSLKSRDIQLYFSDTNLENIITLWDWAGKIPQKTRSIIAANLGVNKANYFVKQNAQSTLTYTDGGLMNEELKYTIINESTGNPTDGGGAYRAYLQFYYPKEMTLDEVFWKGVSIPIVPYNKKSDLAQTVQVNTTAEATIIGLLVTVAPNSSSEIVVHTKQKMPKLPFTYRYSLRKQAGVATLPWKTTFHLANGSMLEYNTDLAEDYHQLLEFK